MTSRFVTSLFAGGCPSSNVLLPVGQKKNLLCGIKDIAIVQGDIDKVKAKLDEAQARWIRFMVLSLEHQFWLAIRYTHPFLEEDGSAVYDVELVRVKHETPINQVLPNKGTLVTTVHSDIIECFDDIFR